MARETINGLSMPIPGSGEPADFQGELRRIATELPGHFAVKTSVPINALEHGVVADGTTDDTAAWTALLATVTSGQRVLLPAGYTSVISSVIELPAAAAGASLIGHGATIKLAGAASGAVMLNLNGPQQSVEGLTFDGNSSSNATGARPKSTHQRIAGCRFANLPAGGVYVQAGTITDLMVEGCRFTGNGYGVLFDTAATASRVTIANNVFVGGNIGDAIEVNTPTGGATKITVTGNVISGYTSVTSSQGIGIGFANVTGGTISGNVISGCQSAGVHLEDRTSQISVAGNQIQDCGRAGVSVQVGAGTVAPSRIAVTGNTIMGCGTVASTGGIALEGAVAIKNCSIVGNIVRGCGRTGTNFRGIDLGSSGDGHTVVGNIVSNTIGTTSAGIRWNILSNTVISANRCYDDQGTKTQQYGIQGAGASSSVLLLGNDLNGNLTGAIEESGITAASASYTKRYNRPGGIDTPAVLPVVSGAVSDTSFTGAVPVNGSMAIDQTNGRIYFRYGNVWHYVNQTA